MVKRNRCNAVAPYWTNVEETSDGVKLTDQQLRDLMIYIELLEKCDE